MRALLDARRRAPTRSTRRSCAASTTTRARCSSSRPTRSAPRAASAAAGATTAWSSSSAARRRPAWAGRPGVERILLAADASRRSRRAAVDLYVALRRARQRARRRSGSPPTARRAGLARAARARRALAEGPAQAGRPRPAPATLRSSATRASTLKDMESGEQDDGRSRDAVVARRAARTARRVRPPRANALPRRLGRRAARRATSATTVRVAGWVHRRRDHGGLIFIDLRDRSGIVQLVFHPETRREAHALAERLRSEHVVTASRRRSSRREEGNVNPNLADRRDRARGRRRSSVLAEAETPPFPIDEDGAGRRDAAPALPRARPAPRAACATR